LDELSKLFSISNEYNFYLAGGTALAFKLKYRISYDLDFFTEIEFDPQVLITKISKSLEIANIKSEEGTAKFVLFSTNISFFHYPYKLLEPFELRNSIEHASALDIALMKITAIANRGLEKDFADLYYAAIKLGGMEKILSRFLDKYPNSNFEHYLKALVYFKDAEGGPRPDVIAGDYNWDKIKEYFIKEVKKLTHSSLK